MQPPTSSKRVIRADIQCLRALAIFSVLGFHLWPHVFPLGYLGVDVFFVISGYLMTSILSRTAANGLTLAVLRKFYNRRAKRILPPYVLAIFGTIVVCQFVLSRSDLIDLKEDAIWALGIGTNIKTIVKKQQYFDSTHLYKFLLHTWSLGLEMQYYVFAPMLLRVVAICPRPLILVSLISGISWASQCLVTDDAVSFGFVGCRLWQFMVGTAAFYVSRSSSNAYTVLADPEAQIKTKLDPNPIRKKAAYTLIIVTLSLLVLLPFISAPIVEYTSIGTRLLSTILTGIIIAFGPKAMILLPVPTVISSTLVYIGDISYSVYLVHWPLVVLTKYVDLFNSDFAFKLLIGIFVLGIVQYTLFEKPLSKQSAKVVYAVIFGLNIACVIILQNQIAISNLYAEPENYLEANENLLAQCKQETDAQYTCKNPNLPWVQKRGFRFTGFLCQYEGTGSLTVLLTGNSYSMRLYQSFVNSAKHKFKKLIVATQDTCTIHKKINGCPDVGHNLPLTLDDIKPDIVIINQRMWETPAFQSPLTDAENDTLIKAMREDWAMISNYTKKIIIIEPVGTFSKKYDILKPIRLNEPDLSNHAVPLEKYKAEVDPGWDRVLKSVNNCPKCKTIEIRNYFCDRKSCAIYDAERRISFYCDYGHHAPTAIKRYMPSIVREIEL